MKFWLKVQKVNQEIREERVVAVCDEELLGKKLNEFVVISKHFYKGELVEQTRVIEELRKATTANIFGNNAIKTAIEARIIDKDNVKEINGIKYSLIFSLD